MGPELLDVLGYLERLLVFVDGLLGLLALLGLGAFLRIRIHHHGGRLVVVEVVHAHPLGVREGLDAAATHIVVVRGHLLVLTRPAVVQLLLVEFVPAVQVLRGLHVDLERVVLVERLPVYRLTLLILAVAALLVLSVGNG